MSPFSEAAWRQKVLAAATTWPDELPNDTQALPLIEELFSAPHSYWNYLNIRFASFIELTTLGAFDMDRVALAHSMEQICQVRDAWPGKGKEAFWGAFTPAACLCSLFNLLHYFEDFGLVDDKS